MDHIFRVVNGFDPGQTVVLYGPVTRLDAILLVFGHLVDVPADTDRVGLEGTPEGPNPGTVCSKRFWVCRHGVNNDVDAGRASSSKGGASSPTSVYAPVRG